MVVVLLVGLDVVAITCFSFVPFYLLQNKIK